jgi:protein O-GlcNAc transferase
MLQPAANANILIVELRLNQDAAAHRSHHDQAELEHLLWACMKCLREQADELIHAGNAEEDGGNIDSALQKYSLATRIAADYPRAWLNLGIALAAKSESDAALDAYDRALALEPANAPAHYNRGLLLNSVGKPALAERAFSEAIKRRPHFPDAYAGLGDALEAQGRLEEATRALREASRQASAHAGYALNLGNLLRKAGNLDEAEAVYRSALHTNPEYAPVAQGLAAALRDQGRHAEACAVLEVALELDPVSFDSYSALLFTLLFRDDVAPLVVYRRHEEFGSMARARMAPAVAPTNSLSKNRRLRIGYVSGDFRRHAVAFFALPVVQGHDRSVFEVFCYSNTAEIDNITSAFRAGSDHWREIRGRGDELVTQLIRDDGIDILVDLSGHTGDNRLGVFAQKAAPVQATWLGYLCTTGMTTIDYRITDSYADPPGSTEELHTETLVRLPNSQWCYRPQFSPSTRAAPPMKDIGFVTFGSFNQFAKISQKTVLLWTKILKTVANARLLLVGAPEGKARDTFLGYFAGSGIHAERIAFAGRLPPAEYYECFNRVDIALDTMPYCGGTTTCDSLWMSVPVVTFAGQAAASRSGASLLNAVGLGELVATSTEDYVSISIALATDAQRLTALRRELRDRMRSSPLMDEVRFVRDFESLYRGMWSAWCEQDHR